MPLGILDSRTNPCPPATILLSETSNNEQGVTALFKHGKGRNENIILSPQPTDDPNDPLNWSHGKKVIITLIVVFGSFVCAGTVSALLNSSLVAIAIQWGRPITDITVISGYQLLVAGASGPFVSAGARKFGKRIVFLLATLFSLIGTIVGSSVNTYNGLLAARIIQGLGIATYESLPFAVVGDLFFVHERGAYITIMSWTMASSAHLATIITGAIADNLGWPYLFHILIAVTAFLLILLVLFVPETTYSRDTKVPAILTDGTTGAATMHDLEILKNNAPTEMHEDVDQPRSQSSIPPKKTWLQEMALVNGIHSRENWLSLLLGPFISLLNVTSLWTLFVSGVLTSFYVAIAFTIAQLFSPPPYLLSTAGVGYMSLGPFIGAALSSILLGLLNDPLALWLTKLNRGTYEPEFRLPLCLLGLMTGAGTMGFGATAQAGGSLYLASFCWGLNMAGVCFSTGAVSTYAIEAFREMSNEIFVANIMFKNFLFYGYSYFINDWTATDGPARVFYIIGGISLGLVATTPLMYVFGKKYRAFWHRNNMFTKFGVQSHIE